MLERVGGLSEQVLKVQVHHLLRKPFLGQWIRVQHLKIRPKASKRRFIVRIESYMLRGRRRAIVNPGATNYSRAFWTCGVSMDIARPKFRC